MKSKYWRALISSYEHIEVKVIREYVWLHAKRIVIFCSFRFVGYSKGWQSLHIIRQSTNYWNLWLTFLWNDFDSRFKVHQLLTFCFVQEHYECIMYSVAWPYNICLRNSLATTLELVGFINRSSSFWV